MGAGRERRLPICFEVREGRQSKFVPYDRVLKDRACGRRVVNQAMHELDVWRKDYGRLFELLDFADWRDLIVLLDKLRGERPQRSPAHTRARKDRQYAQDTFHQAIAMIDAWRRTYGELFERLKHAGGRKIATAVEEVFNPTGSQVFYVWKTDG
jgi:hypothetical protein